jgi:ribosome-binding protein aMBF1 (putative translation factor)
MTSARNSQSPGKEPSQLLFRDQRADRGHVFAVPGFADMIRAALDAKGWSNADLARESGISTNSVSAILREVRAPSLRVASALVSALGLLVWLHAPGEPVAASGSVSPAPELSVKPAPKKRGRKK